MPTSKLATFIGFAIKSRKCRTGMNAIQTLKSVKLMLVCKSASENTKRQAIKVASKYNCPIYSTTNYELSEYVYKPNVKVLAVTDWALAKAVKENGTGELIDLVQTIQQ